MDSLRPMEKLRLLLFQTHAIHVKEMAEILDEPISVVRNRISSLKHNGHIDSNGDAIYGLTVKGINNIHKICKERFQSACEICETGRAKRVFFFLSSDPVTERFVCTECFGRLQYK